MCIHNFNMIWGNSTTTANNFDAHFGKFFSEVSEVFGVSEVDVSSFDEFGRAGVRLCDGGYI